MSRSWQVAESNHDFLCWLMTRSWQKAPHTSEVDIPLRHSHIDVTKVLLHIDGVLCAAVALALPRSLEPLRVAAFSASEATQGAADAWGASELLTFKCVSYDTVSYHGPKLHRKWSVWRCAAETLWSLYPCTCHSCRTQCYSSDEQQ